MCAETHLAVRQLAGLQDVVELLQRDVGLRPRPAWVASNAGRRGHRASRRAALLRHALLQLLRRAAGRAAHALLRHAWTDLQRRRACAGHALLRGASAGRQAGSDRRGARRHGGPRRGHALRRGRGAALLPRRRRRRGLLQLRRLLRLLLHHLLLLCLLRVRHIHLNRQLLRRQVLAPRLLHELLVHHLESTRGRSGGRRAGGA